MKPVLRLTLTAVAALMAGQALAAGVRRFVDWYRGYYQR